MEWEYFTEVSEKVKNVTKQLQGEADKIEQTSNSYWELQQEELGTYEEWQHLNGLTKRLKDVQTELRNVQKKAESEKIFIKFAGATSSGKSSLINALLRSTPLPVGFMQTTMCSFKVCITKEEKWSATVTGENGETRCLPSSENENDIKVLLSKMTGKKHANDRKEMGIGTRSVVQVNWPKDQCKVLPENVVLFDTPGLGEDDKSDEVITESCREADIVVAVMDAMSPSKATVARLVKNVNCQFTFGVFTKWDECIRKQQEESEDTVDVHQTREGYKQDFYEALKGQCETFFVDVKCENTDDEEFKKFERRLQASATKLKCESLIKQAKSVNKTSIEIAGKLKNIVHAIGKEKAESIEKERDSMKTDEDSFYQMVRSLSFQSAEELIEGAYNESTKQIKAFEEGVRKGKPEDVLHAEFIAKVDECTRNTLVRQRNEIRSAFTIWAKNHNWDFNVNKFVSDEIPQCETQGLTEEEYNWKWDLNAYYTNDYLSAAVLLGGSCGVAIAGVAGVAGAVGLIAAESLPAVAGTTILGSAVGGTGGVGGTLFGGLRVGNLVRWFLPISEYKIRCWRRKLRGNLLELYKCSKDLISKDIKEIEDRASEKLDHAKAEKLKKIQEEESKSLNLTTRSKELQESQTRLTAGNTEFDELLIELSEAERKSLAQRDAATW